MPGRSNSTTNSLPDRHASMGIAAGRVQVPNTCSARRSNWRNGSVRTSMAAPSFAEGPFTPSASMVNTAGFLYPEDHDGCKRVPGNFAVNPSTGPEGHAGSGRGVYGISVAAELVGSAPQNLRLYEARGLLSPARSDGGTRLYSDDDLDRLREIGRLLEDGLNLAGIAAVLELRAANRTLQTRIDRQRRR